MGNSTEHSDRNKDQAGQNKDAGQNKNQSGQQHQQGRNDQRGGQQGGSQQGSNGDRMNRKDDSK